MKLENTQQDFVVIGSIGSPHGIQGWMHINAYTADPAGIAKYKSWFVGKGDQVSTYQVAEFRGQGKRFVASLMGINDRDQAASLTNAEIFIPRTELPELAPGEYYWHDLIGLTVINQQQVELGKIHEFFETGANDVMIVRGEKDHLIPYIEGQYVLDVNPEQGTIKVDWDPEF